MADVEKDKRAEVLSPIDRVSEIIFGLIMALTITGSLSVATAGRDEVRTMMLAALGCNLAWGLVDAVMYVVRNMTERARNVTLLDRIRGTANADEARTIIADALPGRLGTVVGAEGIEGMRQRLAALPAPPALPRLHRDDFIGAAGVFLLVVLATFPVVLPFMLIREPMLAMRISNAVALVMLFAAGYALGRYAGSAAWRTGLAMVAIGVFLVVVAMALGG